MSTDATLDPIRDAASPEVAGAVAARIPAVLGRWERSVREQLPRADRLSPTELRDELPDVLGGLSQALAEGGVPGHLDVLLRAGDGHGRQRFGLSYDVDELLLEYGLLRPILVEEVATHLGRDLTAEESAALHAGLDAAARHGVAQLTADQQARLRAAVDGQGKLLSFLSHDLRGNLNGVLLMVEVLKRELAGDARLAESVQDLGVMRQSVLGAVATMDRFLYAERFRAGRVQARPVSVDLRSALADALAAAERRAADKGVPLAVDVPPGVTVVTDASLLSLIVQDLLDNAVRFTAAGSAVAIAVTPGDAGPTEIRVVDHGPGISPDRLAALFRPLRHDDDQPEPGLGLPLARQAADLIGADLRAESTVGQGSTFVLTLR